MVFNDVTKSVSHYPPLLQKLLQSKYVPHVQCQRAAQLPNVPSKNVYIYQVKYRKQASQWKCTEQNYHVQEENYVTHKYVKIFCDTTQFPPF